MKKIFGGLNLTWFKLILFAIIAGIYTAVVALIPALTITSLHDICVSFEVWILFGIIIITNSKSAKDSALKCFVFFLISQPLVYLVQDLINHGELFMTYYRNWILWTVACVPMGYLGYYIKNNKWYSLVILTPILLLLGFHLNGYTSELIYSFPFKLLTVIFCIATLIIYPLYMLNNKRLKNIEAFISVIIILLAIGHSVMNPPVYEPVIMTNSEEHELNENYKATLVDKKYGSVSVEYVTKGGLNDWALVGHFKKRGKSQIIIEKPDGTKDTYNVTFERNTYDFTKVE